LEEWPGPAPRTCRDHWRKERIVLQETSFQLTQVQVSLFTTPDVFPTTKILAAILSNWETVFDGDPVSLPVPEGQAPEVPRILLKSRDDKVLLQLGPVRLDIIRRQTVWGEPILPEEPIALALQVAATYRRSSPRTVERAGFVLHRATVEENPGVALAQHFCKKQWTDDALKRPENFELHAHKAYPFHGLEINSWIRFRTGRIRTSEPGTTPLVQVPGILVEHDLNTLAGESSTQPLDDTAIEAFLAGAPAEAEAIFRKYLG
jgi:hypothetical protein